MRYPEDDLQMRCATLLDLTGVLWCHVANERKTSKIAGSRLKKKGVKSGVPDIMIFEPSHEFVGLAIELKIKPNKTSENQKLWLQNLKNRNWKTKVCYNFYEFLETVEKYLNL